MRGRSAISKNNSVSNLRYELDRLGEKLEIQSRYLYLVERKLKEVIPQADSALRDSFISEEIAPLAGGVSLATIKNADETQPYVSFSQQAAFSEQPRVFDSGKPRLEEVGPSLVPSPGWPNYTFTRSHAQRIVGVSVCGLSSTALNAIVAAIADQQSKLRNFIPVFLTDSSDCEAFQRYGYAWEYFPGATERGRYGGSVSWAAYAASRRKLLEQKWGLDQVICFGTMEFGRIEEIPMNLPARQVPHNAPTTSTSGRAIISTGEPTNSSSQTTREQALGDSSREVESQPSKVPRGQDDLEAAKPAQSTRIAALQQQVAALIAERDVLRAQVRGQQTNIEQQYHQLCARASSDELEARLEVTAKDLAKLRNDFSQARDRDKLNGEPDAASNGRNRLRSTPNEPIDAQREKDGEPDRISKKLGDNP